ncbi:phage tail protein [Streptomyces lasiicapitis]|uniref:phage tail protein n=1 Tax=Streptomyces lasiicapitis TaxID=1923961 RepID=UPI003698830E
MALTVGELTGFIDLDDSGAQRGLARTRAGLDELARGTDGRLRDLRGRFVAESAAMGGALGDNVRSGAVRAAKGLALVGGAVPLVAAGTAALGGLAAGAVAAGLAVKAFSAAVGPQMEAVQEVATLAVEAEKAAAEGAADAAEKQQAYTDALSRLPPATRDAATAFIGLKSDYQAWSDSLSTTTMPVVTKGITVLRDLLPTLTPFVEAAAGAFGGFFDDVSAGVKSAEFKEWASETSAVAGPALRDILTVVKNFAIGFGGLLQAFLPASAGVTGGLVDMSAAFADWGTSLDDSEGFATFLDLADQGGETLADLGGAAIALLVALSPLIGVGTQLAMVLAQIISGIPTPVLTGFAIVLGSVTVATKAWALAQAVVAARNRIWTGTQWALNASMFASPVFWIIAAIVALVAVVVLIATKTTWFQTAWSTAWGFIKSTTDTAVSGIGTALNWFASLPGRLGGWFGSAKDAAIAKLSELRSWLAGFPARAGVALAALPGALRQRAVAGFSAFRSAAGQQAGIFLGWVRGFPRSIAAGIGSLGGLLRGHGRDVVRGLWAGIRSMGGWLKSTITGWAKSVIPGPVARALRIGSPSRLMADEVGRWIPAGIVQGIESGQGAVDRTMRNLVTTPTPGQATAAAMAAQTSTPAGGAVGGGRLVLDVTGADAEFKRLIRRMVRVDGRGSVQTAFGT